jgi:tetratricopeptide (TPR) repeat protein
MDPSEANIYALGMEFLRHWTFDAAIKEFTLGVQKFPDSERLHAGLGLAYYANVNYDQSISTLSNVVSSDPNDTFAAELLGRACTALAEGSNPGCAVLIHAAQIHPNDAVLATYAAASMLHKQGASSNLELARQFLDRAIKQSPELAQAHFELGVLLQNQNQWKESIDPLQTAIRLKPDDAQAHYRLSRAYAHEQRLPDAQKEIALFKQYSSAQQESIDSKMKEITTLIVKFQ